MPRVVKRSASQAVTYGPSRRGVPLPQFVPPQLSQPVEKPPSGPQWVHEIKLDGFRMAARIDNGRAQLLTRTGLEWTDKYPNAVAALVSVKAKTAYLDGELCGLDDAGLPSFRPYAGGDGRRARRASRLLRFRSFAPRWAGRLGPAAHRTQGALISDIREQLGDKKPVAVCAGRESRTRM
jgi:ATP-dependent DNA ligase